MEPVKKIYTSDEIQKIAPNYRGGPENFDPAKVGKKGKKRAPQKPKDAKQKPRPGPTSGELPAPTRPQRAPTAQRNESIIAESIFGIDVFVTEIAPRQEFNASYNRLVDMSLETYQNFRADERQLDRILAKEEMAYYATSLLWFKLLDVKAKEGNVALTSEEKAIRKAVTDEQLNVPQPVYAMLSEVGNYTDKMGQETKHQVPALPTTVVQGFGGYPANAIDLNTHNLFEEVPSMDIAGDMVMALASPDNGPMQGAILLRAKPSTPINTVHIDCLGPLPASSDKFKHILVLVDAFTKYCKLIPLKTVKAHETQQALQNFISSFGTPKVMIMDGGSIAAKILWSSM
jgi:hypothetical protein